MTTRHLADGEVVVWAASLAVDKSRLETLRSSLSTDEIERASRFRFARDRHRFVAGRSFLRRILADYTGDRAEALRFSYGPYGKPRLAERQGIQFNVSHSEDRMLVAVSANITVGVDVEVLNSKHADELVAERFFSAREVQDLRSLPSSEWSRSFLTCWTRKEAFIKARGEGLSLPLQDFDVTLAPGVSPALVRTAWSATEPAEWLLFDISENCAGCVAAVAVRAAHAVVSVRRHGSWTAGSEPRSLALCAPS
jgi:4'-phosphopantetheinyl transferase